MSKQKEVSKKIQDTLSAAKYSIQYGKPFQFSISQKNKSRINLRKEYLFFWVRIFQLLNIAKQLLINGQTATKRNIFYRLKKYYKSYQQLDEDIETICINLNIKRKQLNILASSKGLFCGFLNLKCDDQQLEGNIQSITVIPTAKIVKPLAVKYKDILIVEKQSIFQQIHYSHCTQTNSLSQYLIVSSKGYPDFNIRQLLDDLKQYSSNVFYLGDQDIFGFDILLTYTFPSRQYSGLLHKIHWLDPLRLAENNLLDNNVLMMEQMPYNGQDLKKSRSLEQKKWYQLQDNLSIEIKSKLNRWHQRVIKMCESKKKIELQTIVKASKIINWVKQTIDRSFYD